MRSQVHLFGQHLAHQLFAQCRDFVPSCFWREGPLPFLHPLHEFQVIIVMEGWNTSQHDKEYDASRPHVHFLCVRLHPLLQHLRCHVVDRANLGGQGAQIEALRSSKVDEFHLPILNRTFLGDEEVFGLQVSMTNHVHVDVGNSTHDLLEEQGSSVFVEGTSLNHGIEELAALAELRSNEDAQVILKGVVQPHDVRVIQLFHDLDLGPQLVAGDELFGAALYRMKLASLRVLCSPHRSEGAGTDLLSHFVHLTGMSLNMFAEDDGRSAHAGPPTQAVHSAHSSHAVPPS
mmetsp:Transcript_32269/g.69735  ORF Transcript_32269/g.69735 Transcript_32269/m.69735 type:complete len:289 (-) Transcript_32269:304-1170(-)